MPKGGYNLEVNEIVMSFTSWKTEQSSCVFSEEGKPRWFGI